MPRSAHDRPEDIQNAGTGFMQQPSEAISYFEKKGYNKNLVPRFDHFEVDSGKEKLFPGEFEVDDMVRFENTSDPDDQSILYAITSASHGIKGLFLESYGIYTEELSRSMVEKLKEHGNRSENVA